MNTQTVQWQYQPHQGGNIGLFLSCFTLVTIPWAVWAYMTTKGTRYWIAGEKLYVRQGVWSVREKEVHLNRVKLLRVQRTLGSLLGVDDIIVETHNDLLPMVKIRAVKNASETENYILRLIDGQRQVTTPSPDDP